MFYQKMCCLKRTVAASRPLRTMRTGALGSCCGQGNGQILGDGQQTPFLHGSGQRSSVQLRPGRWQLQYACDRLQGTAAMCTPNIRAPAQHKAHTTLRAPGPSRNARGRRFWAARPTPCVRANYSVAPAHAGDVPILNSWALRFRKTRILLAIAVTHEIAIFRPVQLRVGQTERTAVPALEKFQREGSPRNQFPHIGEPTSGREYDGIMRPIENMVTVHRSRLEWNTMFKLHGLVISFLIGLEVKDNTGNLRAIHIFMNNICQNSGATAKCNQHSQGNLKLPKLLLSFQAKNQKFKLGDLGTFSTTTPFQFKKPQFKQKNPVPGSHPSIFEGPIWGSSTYLSPKP
ncbi:hypothetical protein K438DRAFT_1748090 [Mycena galopus ATCC 62051]|nr:hypothetical protein K438DRAFT_1748090 [Mycena galopus ATCC 62051]